MVQWQDPWHPVNDLGPDFAEAFERVLAGEVAPGDELYGVSVQAIGKRGDTDDVLFRLLDGSERVAVVHLTWTQSPPERPPWPATELFPNLEAWAENVMGRD